MKRKGLKLLLVVGLLMSWATAAMCAETYDPNAGSAASEKPASGDLLSSDARLSVKATYSGKKVPVRDVVDALTTASSVTLRAGTNTKDWEVRDRKINIFAKETPLYEVMNSISRVTGFKWSVEGTEDKPVYRLIWDMKSRLAVAALRDSIHQADEQAAADLRKQGLDSIQNLDGLSADDLAKLRVDNPYLFWMAASGMSKSLNGFINNTPGLAQTLLSGDTKTISGSSLSAAGQKGLTDLIGSSNKLMAKFGGKNANEAETPGNLADATITVNPTFPGGGANFGGRGAANFMRNNMLGSIVVHSPNTFAVIPLFNPNSQMAKGAGKILIETDLLNRPMQDVMKELGPEMMKQMQQNFPVGAGATTAATTTDAQGNVIELTDPVLDAKIKAKLDGRTLPDVQEQLAAAAGIAIVSDNYGGRPMFGPPGGPMGGAPGAANAAAGAQETTLRKALDSTAQRYQYQWGKTSKPIEFQDKEWYDKIPLLIPDELIDNWKKVLTTTKTLGMTELAQMAALTNEQFMANITSDDMLGKLNLQWSIMQNKDILQLFGSLNKSQASAAFTSAGFNVRTLGDDIQPLVKKVTGQNPALADQNAPLTLKAAVSTKDGPAPMVVVTITNGTETTTPATWRIMLPKYDPSAPNNPGFGPQGFGPPAAAPQAKPAGK